MWDGDAVRYFALMSGLCTACALWEGMFTLCNVETRATENVPGTADLKHPCSLTRCREKFWWNDVAKIMTAFRRLTSMRATREQKTLDIVCY